MNVGFFKACQGHQYNDNRLCGFGEVETSMIFFLMRFASL
jgi:hypothetical protein